MSAPFALVANEVAAAQEFAMSAKESPPPAEALCVLNGIANPVKRNAVIPTISIFQGKELEEKTSVVQSKGILVDPAAGGVGGLAFDSSHNLWFSLCPGFSQAGYLIKVDYSQIADVIDRHVTAPSEVIGDPSPSFVEYLSCPSSIAFDQAGDLWVSVGPNSGSRLQETALIEYTSTQLAVSGEPTPTVVIATPEVGIYVSPSMTFDGQGNLWQAGGVLNPTSSSYEQTIVEYSSAQLAAGDQTDPYQTLVIEEGEYSSSLWYPSSVVFDNNGNLWVAFNAAGNQSTGGIEMFAASALTGQGISTPIPAITLNASVSEKSADFSFPNGLAFDAAGDLWVADRGQLFRKPYANTVGALVEFAPTQLTASGSPLPIRMILPGPNQQNLAGPRLITFGPPLPQ
jgi:hypothetical protein